MLPRDQRLSRKEFTPVFKLGKRLNTGLFSVIYKKKENIKPKFSVVVSKKVTKSSVARHKIRRWIYESTRAFLKENTTYNFDTIFIIQPSITKFDFQSIKEKVSEVLTNAL